MINKFEHSGELGTSLYQLWTALPETQLHKALVWRLVVAGLL